MKRTLATVAMFASIGMVAAGCGNSSNNADASTGNEQTGGPSSGGQGPGGGPAGSGMVTDVSGSTAQVQGQQSQVAVTWTGSTTFTKDVTTDGSAVKVGSCVAAFAVPASGTSPSPDSTPSDTVAATSVRITAATNGTCTLQRGAGGGTPPDGAPEGGSRERPTDLPSNGAGRGFGGGAIGTVTKVTDTGFTVASEQPGSSTKTTTVTVTTGGSTVYSTTGKATASDVKVGVCVTSSGKADDTGAITAKTIAVSKPTDGECGFGGFGPRP